jgi:hypothetical protein
MFDEQTRPHAIKRFLAKPPKNAHKMTLAANAVGTDATVTLATWAVDDELVPGLCDEILQSLDDHAGEMNAAICAVLTYWTATDVKLTERVINRANPNTGKAESLGSTGAQLTGDYTAQAVQAQKHLEVVMRMTLQNLDRMFALQQRSTEHVMDLCDNLAQRVIESDRRAERAAQERDQANDVIQAMEAERGEDSEVSASQARIIQMLQPVIASVVAKALVPATQLPPSPPSPPQ